MLDNDIVSMTKRASDTAKRSQAAGQKYSPLSHQNLRSLEQHNQPGRRRKLVQTGLKEIKNSVPPPLGEASPARTAHFGYYPVYAPRRTRQSPSAQGSVAHAVDTGWLWPDGGSQR